MFSRSCLCFSLLIKGIVGFEFLLILSYLVFELDVNNYFLCFTVFMPSSSGTGGDTGEEKQKFSSEP